ncbi:MAG: T9SS type A sorting domain-containing protein [Ignavibacteria bacterium]|nr:T9SS type A sorting domain-containing protein [Ignavibacteria bacterium]
MMDIIPNTIFNFYSLISRKFKIFFPFILSVSLSWDLMSQVSNLWISRYNGNVNNADVALSMAVDNDHVYIAGYTTEANEDIIVLKYTSSGTEIWKAIYNGSGNSSDKPSAIELDGNGNIYVCGYSTTKNGAVDFLILKVNSEGEIIWTKTLDGGVGKNDQATDLHVEEDGSVVVTGFIETEESGIDYLTVKLNSGGDIVWQKKYNGSGNSTDRSVGVTRDRQGYVYVTGTSSGYQTGFDFCTIKYSASGDSVWVRRYNGISNGNDEAVEILISEEGDVYVTGSTFVKGNGMDIATVKYNSSGVQQWVSRYNGQSSLNEMPVALHIDNEGNIVVSGNSAGSGTNWDMVTIKYNSQGAEIWSSVYNGSANNQDLVTSMVVDKLGSIYVTGMSWNGSDDDFLILKYNSLGEQLWVSSYNGSGNSADQASNVLIDNNGNVLLSGSSIGSGTSYDITTIKYRQAQPQVFPQLLSPAHNSVGIPLNAFFDWDDVSGCDFYRIQISRNESFSSVVYDTSVFSLSQFTIPDYHLQNNTTYFWRINCNNIAGPGPWSQVWRFTVLTKPEIPEPLSPANGSNGNPSSLILSWKKVLTAASYRVQVATDRKFSNTVLDVENITTNELTISPDKLNSNTVYFWRINATNEAGTVPWSEAWAVGIGNVQPPQPPKLLSLPDASTGQSLTPVLDWEDVPGATEYSIQVASDLNFLNVVVNESGLSESSYHIQPGVLQNGKTYYWKVSARNVGGVSNYSLIWTFTTLLGQLEKIGNKVPSEFRLYPNDPEPFASTTVIRFDVPAKYNGTVQIIIYDSKGREVTKLVNQKLSGGTYKINWDAGNYNRGYYLYQIKSENFVETRKMRLIK